MNNVAEELRRVVDSTAVQLHSLDEATARTQPTPTAWSIQQIIGHLIDSAVNNHQRFVRAQATDALTFPGYDQDVWVHTQAYNTSPWPDLIELWRLYNRHLAQVISHVPEEKLSVEVRIGSNTPATLQYIMEDYVVHLKHHLHEIEKRMAHVSQ